MLDEEKAKELITRGYESSDLDYKVDFDNSTAAWMELAKDVYGIANYGGGYVVIGVEDGTFKPIGLPCEFHIDTQEWANKLSKWISNNLEIEYFEYIMKIENKEKKFPILFIRGSIASLAVPKNDGVYKLPSGDQKTAFRTGVIYTRDNTSTVPATGQEYWKLFWSLLKRTAEKTGAQNTPLEVLSTLNQKAAPNSSEETLWTNLFPVIQLPDQIFTANTELRYAKEIYDLIKDSHVPAFILHDKKIYSFTSFDDKNPLIKCITQQNTPIETKDWFTDDANRMKLTQLLNFNLKKLCFERRFFYDKKYDRYFIRYNGGVLPETTWKPYKSTSTRKLVNLNLSKNGDLQYCEHFAGRLKFILLGEGIYLLVEPTRVLTTNGENPLDHEKNVRIRTKKNALYHNNNYLYDTKLWLHILAGTRHEIHLGDENSKIIVSVTPVTAKTSFGIIDDQHTGGDFLDMLKSEPLDYQINFEDGDDENPLTETSLED